MKALEMLKSLGRGEHAFIEGLALKEALDAKPEGERIDEWLLEQIPGSCFEYIIHWRVDGNMMHVLRRSIPLTDGSRTWVRAKEAHNYDCKDGVFWPKLSMPYDRKFVALEGKLDVAMLKAIQPIGCRHNCDTNERYLCGWARKETTTTSLHALHLLLEQLNGKEIKVTVEWKE